MPNVFRPVLSGQVHVRVDDRGDSAALLLGNHDLDAVALQHGDHLLSEPAFVEVDPATVEIGNRAARLSPSRMSFNPPFERQPLVARLVTVPMNTNDLLHHQPN